MTSSSPKRTFDRPKCGERTQATRAGRPRGRRAGKILVILAIILPTLIGFAGLVIDASMLMAERRNLQHAGDAAATAAAVVLQTNDVAGATAAAVTSVQSENGFGDATVAVHIPPTTGSKAGNNSYAEVVVSRQVSTFFIQLLGNPSVQQISARSVAGTETSTAGAAVVVLESSPPGITADSSAVPSLSVTLPPLQLAGLEVLGQGQLKVDGAVLVNTEWGGRDEQDHPAGRDAGPPYGVSCMPVVSLTKLLARDIRVVGGVDDSKNYASFTSGQRSPLRVGKLPVSDPCAGLKAPTVTADRFNVNATLRGGVKVSQLASAAPAVLNPGVYDWIEIVSGRVTFNSGVYIVRGVNSTTHIGLNILGGTVTANSVMFYITDSTGYSAASGAPDSSDGTAGAPAGSTGSVLPSVVLASLLGSSYTGLSDPRSGFKNLLIYQRRLDRRPIVIADENLVLGGTISGVVYAKYAQVLFAASGTYDLRFVAGSMRFANLLECTLAPTKLYGAATDVFLVE